MTDKYVFAQRVMASVGTTTDESDWDARTKDFYLALCDQLPLRRLRASEVKFEYEMEGGPAMIRAYLLRSAQGWLSLANANDPPSDPFNADIELIERARRRLREDFEYALKASINPASDLEVVQRRNRLWTARNDGFLTIYTTTEGESFPIDSVPQWMPHAEVTELTFIVDRIERTRCCIRIQGEAEDPASVAMPVETPTSREMFLHRAVDARGVTTGRIFSTSLEERVPLTAKVRTEFRWTDGSIGRRTLANSTDLAIAIPSSGAQSQFATSPWSSTSGDSIESAQAPQTDRSANDEPSYLPFKRWGN